MAAEGAETFPGLPGLPSLYLDMARLDLSMVLVLVATLFCTILFMQLFRADTQLTELPGPRPWPLIGNLPQLGLKGFLVMTRLSKQYGDIYRVRIGCQDAVILNSRRSLRAALLRQAETFAGRPSWASFREIAGGKSMAFNSYSEPWHQHRTVARLSLNCLLKSTKKDSVQNFITETMQMLCDDLIQRSVQSGEQPLDPLPFIEMGTSRIMFMICFGKKHVDEHRKFIVETLDEFRQNIAVANIADIMPWTTWIIKSYIKQYANVMKNYFVAIEEKLAETALDGGGDDSVGAVLQRHCNDLGDAALESRGLSRQQVMHSVEDLIGAGTETSTNFIHWAMLYLAKNPGVQQRALAQIEQVLGLDVTPTMEHQALIPYLEACVLEIIRHSALAPVTMPHRVTKETMLCGYRIPKDMLVIGNLHALGNDPQVWEQPDDFAPERFLEGDGFSINRQKAQLMCTFGLGKRRCLGEMVARMSTFLSLTCLIQKCEFLEAPGHALKYDGIFTFTYRSKPYKIAIKARRSQ